VGERVGVGLPHGHRVRHQLAHRRLEVVVADDPAGDPRGASADAALVEDEDVLAAAMAAGPQFPGQMPRGGEPVNPRADDDVTAGGREGRVGHRFTLLLLAPPALAWYHCL